MKTILTFYISFLFSLVAAQAQWINQTVPSHTGKIRKIHIIDINHLWAETTSNLPGMPQDFLLRTTNGGLTWTAVPVTLPNVGGQFSITSLEPVDHNKAFITVEMPFSFATKIYKTTDGGQNWTLIPNMLASSNSHINFIHFFDYQNGILMGDNQGIYTTANGGTTWVQVPQPNLPAPTTMESTTDLRVSFGDTIWVPVNDSRIYKSTDNGLTWTVSNTIFTPGAYVSGLAFQDVKFGLASLGANLSRTTNGGLTWTPVTYTGPLYQDGIIHLPGTLNHYLSYSALGMSLTTDGGLTWTNVDNAVHYSSAFLNNMVGWSAGNGVMRKFSGFLLGTSKATNTPNSFLIYPNPSSSTFHITPSSTAPFNLEVYDLVGNKVMQQKGNSFGKNTIDLSGQKKGIYLLHILNGEQRIIEKIVLQ